MNVNHVKYWISSLRRPNSQTREEQFAMTFSYEQSSIHSRYDVGRVYSSNAMTELMEAIRRHAPGQVRRIIDLGCGTGRFTKSLFETFDVPVVGVEPAKNMR